MTYDNTPETAGQPHHLRHLPTCVTIPLPSLLLTSKFNLYISPQSPLPHPCKTS